MRMGLAAVLLGLATAGSAQASATGTEQACPALANLAGSAMGDASARITQARWQTAATAPRDPGSVPRATPLPPHCELFGTMQERQGANGQTYAIRFHMRLPAAWNGRFFFGGGGGSDGVVGSATGNLLGAQPGSALDLGYAVVTQDSGHDNATNNDPSRQGVITFGFDAEARRNYGFASIGAVTTVAKRIIAAYYGRRPAYSYFVGGSKGGQEAFMAAQRFGREFDGVLAGYPGFRLATAGTAGEMWDDQAFAAAARAQGGVDPNGVPLLGRSFSDADLALVQRAILDACDRLDGLEDGMVFALGRCTTDLVRPRLARLTCADGKRDDCLVPAQVEALMRVFGGARTRDGRQLYAPLAWDAGIGGRSAKGWFHGWRDWKIGRYDATVNDARNVTLAVGAVSAVLTSPPRPLVDDPTIYTRYALGLNVEATEAASHVRWGRFNEASVDFMNADAHDLSAFAGHGGKLLVFHGAADPVFSIEDTIAWLRAVDRFEKGRAARFVRLFAVPGMNHGGGGPSTDQADYFAALVAWTEHGVAPDRLIATARAETAWPGRTRPLCAWPKAAHYVGGDRESAASFACR